MDQSDSALSRLAWFFAKNLFVILVILLLLGLAFMTAMSSANIYVVVEEGMVERVAVVLENGEAEGLTRYFTDSFIGGDSMLTSKRYQNYDIDSYTYLGEPSISVCWPWQNSAIVRVTDVVSGLDGDVLSGGQEGGETSGTSAPPEWDNGIYNVRLRKISGKWKIDSMQLVELVKIEKSAPPSETPKWTPVSTGTTGSVSPNAFPTGS